MSERVYEVIAEEQRVRLATYTTIERAFHEAWRHEEATGEVCAVWERTAEYAAFRGSTRVGRCG